MSGAREQHLVSDEHADRTERVLAATPGLAAEPTDAERTRTLLASTTHAHLATVGAGEPVGYPFGSLVGYALDDDGRPILCLSDLAEHSANLAADSRASLLVAVAPAEGVDPLATARATLVGDMREVPTSDRQAAHDRYRQVQRRRLLQRLCRLPDLPPRGGRSPLRRRFRPDELGLAARIPGSPARPPSPRQSTGSSTT